MNVKLYEKKIVTKFIIIDNIEFNLSNLYVCIDEIKNTKENDKYGDNSLRIYEITYPNDMKKLVDLGLVKNYRGPRMSDLYCMADERAINELELTIYNLNK